jgi:hypothetical protein
VLSPLTWFIVTARYNHATKTIQSVCKLQRRDPDPHSKCYHLIHLTGTIGGKEPPPPPPPAAAEGTEIRREPSLAFFGIIVLRRRKNDDPFAPSPEKGFLIIAIWWAVLAPGGGAILWGLGRLMGAPLAPAIAGSFASRGVCSIGCEGLIDRGEDMTALFFL